VILAFEQLKDYRTQVAMVDGAFDPLHRGHIEYFRAAAAQLDVPLLCNVASDRYVRTKHPPLLPEEVSDLLQPKTEINKREERRRGKMCVGFIAKPIQR